MFDLDDMVYPAMVAFNDLDVATNSADILGNCDWPPVAAHICDYYGRGIRATSIREWCDLAEFVDHVSMLCAMALLKPNFDRVFTPAARILFAETASTGSHSAASLLVTFEETLPQYIHEKCLENHDPSTLRFFISIGYADRAREF